MSTSTQITKPYSTRALTHQSQTARRLLKLMSDKRTNLCASLDVTTSAELLSLADKLGPYICMVKTHVDIISDFTYDETVVKLVALAKKHGFMIFEDRKFADIGNTVKNQYSKGVYRIVEWADITNAHSVPGEGIINGLREAANEYVESEKAKGGECENLDRGLIMLAELSSKGSLATGSYTTKTVELAHNNSDFVFGFIAQNRMEEVQDSEGNYEDWLILTPGVGLDDKGDGLGQQYRTVDTVIKNGSDVIIVGRGLFGKGRDPVVEGKRYRDAGWKAYEERIN
uniref:Orotidine 5'-phosphate decarboxylase n=1 Tax=Magnusiomyces magnusii TaxID=43963 RepID=PYRF_MAGMU|nr:RecName: Full=Orotidine 5'-phosphate decarboxylase; AltName: Full=OMP decarboxylase; Short=OMPDCase; Short=OMPdecase; AltName: Full=Uridine 5'-monophosphate synthase; Short=UMP synthase [Magnusiomyces magnusii]CAA65135.1 orotidine 5' phosphate decarboxylase [Magnusiomyces magnusii]